MGEGVGVQDAGKMFRGPQRAHTHLIVNDVEVPRQIKTIEMNFFGAWENTVAISKIYIYKSSEFLRGKTQIGISCHLRDVERVSPSQKQ